MFSGGLLPGTDARQARLRLTAFFRLEDPAAVEPFFRGGAVTLRRALPEAKARMLCEKLVAGGFDCHLVATAAPVTEPAANRRPAGRAAPAPPPNLFQIRGDHSRQDAADGESAQLRFLAMAVTTGVAGVALLVAILARLAWWAPALPVTGPDSIVAAADGTLYMLAGNRLLVHNRAGSSVAQYSAAALGLETVDRLLRVRDGMPIVSATIAGAHPAARRLWQCSLGPGTDEPACTALTDEPLAVESVATSGLAGTLFAITSAGQMVRIAKGIVQERVDLPRENPAPRLINHRGLLLLNNSDGPGIRVYRPDAAAFGQQLDEILLLHPAAIARGHNRVRDFAYSTGARWALLSGDRGTDLYRFDVDWAPAQVVTLPATIRPQYLATWRDRLLAYTPDSLRVERINPEGQVEAPLLSGHLAALAKSTQARARRHHHLFGLGLLALAIVVTVAGTLTWMNFHRRATWHQLRTPPAFLLEHRLQQLAWLPPDPRRKQARGYWTLTAPVAAVSLIAAGMTALPALAAISLPLLLLALAARHNLSLPPPQIGTNGNDLALVDHHGVYQTGPANSFQRWGPFILRGGVIGCTGLPGLPGVRDAGLAATCGPGRPATVLELLLASRHPLLLFALAIPAGLAILAVWQIIPAAA